MGDYVRKVEHFRDNARRNSKACPSHTHAHNIRITTYCSNALWKITTRCDFSQRVPVLTNRNTWFLQRVVRSPNGLTELYNLLWELHNALQVWKCIFWLVDTTTRCEYPQRVVAIRYGPYGLLLDSTTHCGYLGTRYEMPTTRCQKIRNALWVHFTNALQISRVLVR